MKVARVMGAVVASIRDERLKGLKLLLLREVDAAWKPVGMPFVAVDTVGAGPDDLTLVATGQAACQTERTQGLPIDAAVVAILDLPEAKDRGR